MLNIGSSDKRVKPFSEAGVTGATVVGGWLQDRERNPKLTYLQRNTRYEEVMANIAVVGAGIRYFTSLAASVEWSVEPSETDTDGQYAEILERAMDSVDQSWSDVVKHALMYRYLGFSVSELVALKDGDGTILLKSIEHRPQRTIKQFDVDEYGTVLGFGQQSPTSGQTFYIPRAKTLYLVDSLIDDSPAGMGILRHVFESCERLKAYLQTESFGFSKDLRGIPVGRIPYSELNKAVSNGEITQDQANIAIQAMEKLVRSSRKLPDTGIILDSKTYESRSDTGISVSGNRQWDLELLQGVSPGLQEIGLAIERIQKEIARVLSSEALQLDGGGSNALSKDKSSNAYLAVNSSLKDVSAQMNKDIIPFLYNLNGVDKSLWPKFKVEDVSEHDVTSVTTALKDMAAAGAVLQPDDPVINDVRQLLGLQEVDLEQAMNRLLDEQQQQQDQFQATLESKNNNGGFGK